MYSFDSRVRYSETGENGRLSIRGMIDYMQDCSTFQSEDAGVGVRYFEESHKAWMLSSWRIRIRQMRHIMKNSVYIAPSIQAFPLDPPDYASQLLHVYGEQEDKSFHIEQMLDHFQRLHRKIRPAAVQFVYDDQHLFLRSLFP